MKSDREDRDDDFRQSHLTRIQARINTPLKTYIWGLISLSVGSSLRGLGNMPQDVGF